MENNAQLIAQCEATAKQWLSPAFDEETRKAVEQMRQWPQSCPKRSLFFSFLQIFYANVEKYIL